MRRRAARARREGNAMTITRRALGAAALAAPALLAARGAGAQGAFPTRAVRIIVPYTPGGVSDITARLIAEPLAAAWGQPVPVENRAGADGVIGTEVVARAPADGYTLGAGLGRASGERRLLPAALRHDARLHLRHADHRRRRWCSARRAPSRRTRRPSWWTTPSATRASPSPAPAAWCGWRPCCSRSAPASSWNTCPIAAAPRRIRT